MTPYSLPKLNVGMTVIGKEDVVVTSGTYENCFIVYGEMEMLQVKLWVTEQGIVPQAEITQSVPDVGLLKLTMKLEHYE